MTMDTTPPELRKAKEMAADPRYAGIWWPTDEQIATARLGHSGAVLAVTSTLSAPASDPQSPSVTVDAAGVKSRRPRR